MLYECTPLSKATREATSNGYLGTLIIISYLNILYKLNQEAFM